MSENNDDIACVWCFWIFAILFLATMVWFAWSLGGVIFWVLSWG